MDRSKAASRRWLDRRAGRYEGGATSRWRDPIQQASLAAVDLTGDDVLLDVGCGTGTASRAAGPVAKFVVGVDLAPEMIRRATELATGVENVRFVIADSEQLPFDDDEFTAVLCSNSFHHYPDPLRAVREMARVLASDGRLVIGDACADLTTARIADAVLRRIEPAHVRLYGSSELGSFLQRSGFSRVMLRKLSGGGFAIVRGTAA